MLGPLLFLIYIYDTSKSSKVLNFILCADDTNLFYSNKNIDTLFITINQESKEITMWLSANKLSLNLNKTHYMVFKTKKEKDV